MINGVVKATSGSGTLNNPPSSNQVAGSDFTLLNPILPYHLPILLILQAGRSSSSASSGLEYIIQMKQRKYLHLM